MSICLLIVSLYHVSGPKIVKLLYVHQIKKTLCDSLFHSLTDASIFLRQFTGNSNRCHSSKESCEWHVRLVFRPSFCKFFTVFTSSLEPHGQIIKLGIKHPYGSFIFKNYDLDWYKNCCSDERCAVNGCLVCNNTFIHLVYNRKWISSIAIKYIKIIHLLKWLWVGYLFYQTRDSNYSSCQWYPTHSHEIIWM